MKFLIYSLLVTVVTGFNNDQLNITQVVKSDTQTEYAPQKASISLCKQARDIAFKNRYFSEHPCKKCPMISQSHHSLSATEIESNINADEATTFFHENGCSTNLDISTLDRDLVEKFYHQIQTSKND